MNDTQMLMQIAQDIIIGSTNGAVPSMQPFAGANRFAQPAVDTDPMGVRPPRG